MTTAPDQRRRELAQIHIAKAQLNMADDSYRAMLWTCGRVDSSAKLDHAGRAAVLAHLKACGFKPSGGAISSKPSEWSWVNKAAADRQPLLRKIIMQLRASGRGKAYADALAARMFGAERIEFCGPGQLHKIVTALNMDAARKSRPHPNPPPQAGEGI